MKKAAFLDRDGTINADRGYVYRKEDFMFLPGAVDGMRRIEKLGYRLIIITNQSGIGRGYYTESDYKKLEEWMLRQLKAQEVSVTAVFPCHFIHDSSCPNNSSSISSQNKCMVNVCIS